MPVCLSRMLPSPGTTRASACRLLLMPCLLLAGPPSATAAAPGSDKAPSRQAQARIVVTSPAGKPGAAPGQVTLHDALSEAAQSRIPVTIEFDADTLGKSGAIRLLEPIVLDSTVSAIRVDASKGKTPLVIDASACGDAGFMLGGDAQLTLSGMTIRGGRQRVILCKERARLTLEKTTICDGSMPGVAAFGKTRLLILDSRLINNRTHGLELHGQCEASLQRVELSANGQSGIAGFDAGRVTADQCRLESNGEWGIVLTDESQGELTGCTIRKSRFANADVSGSARFTASACELLDGRRFGLFATGRTTVQLTSTRIAASASRGVEAQDQATLRLDKCRIEGGGDYGLILFGQSRVTAGECTFAANAAHGASLRAAASGDFVKCTFTGNRFSGLGCLDGHDGGAVSARECIFTKNGMRPLYRGPLHIDPLVPTPLRVQGSRVQCLADPAATIDLYLDRAGEASRYIGSCQADQQGRFEVDGRQIPEGWAITAAATSAGATSEFNVIAANPSTPILDALLGRTGPLSDEGGGVDLDMLVRRWPPGTRIVFQIEHMPSEAIERYLRFLRDRVPDWTGGGLRMDITIGPPQPLRDGVAVPIRYVGADAQQLASRGGVTYMRWDSNGFFLPPMEIVLALGREPRETCPRVLAHEIGHALGLCHARVGLLSRMQGSAASADGYINDFSPMMTYYDVVALQALHDPRNNAGGVTLRQLVQRGAIPSTQVVAAPSDDSEPTFSPRPAEPPAGTAPTRDSHR